jgi:hypothetical protein
MDYETRRAQAHRIYAAGMRRISEEPEPSKQKFHNGSRVRIGKMPSYMSHFTGETEATVCYTYAHAYGGDDVKSYCLDVDGEGRSSWYEENQLTAIS